MNIALRLLVALLLVIANAAFVAIEFALVAVDRNRVNERAAGGDRRARLVQRLVSRLSLHLSGAQIGITVTSLLLGFIAEPAVAVLISPGLQAIFGESAPAGISVAITLAIATSVQMVMGELVPKTVATTKPYGTATLLARTISIYGVVVRPIVVSLNSIANWIVRRFGIEPREDIDSTPDRDELKHLFASSGAQGVLDQGEVQLLTRSIRLADKQANEAMVPRMKVVVIRREASVAELAKLAIATGHSRFPVVTNNLDNVVGVAHVKLVYKVPAASRNTTTVSELMQPVLAVPESRDLDDLLEDLRTGAGQLAVVIDEHGGGAGIITLEDILEEIIGEIDDEHDRIPTHPTTSQSSGSMVLAGELHPDEVLDTSGFAMPKGDYETLGGLILDRLGHIPAPGETITVNNWELEVLTLEGRRIATVRLIAPQLNDKEGQQ